MKAGVSIIAKDPEPIAHQEWRGYVQSVGLIVSTPVLQAAQTYINKNIIPEHQRFLECVEPISVHGGKDPVIAVTAPLPLSGCVRLASIRLYLWWQPRF